MPVRRRAPHLEIQSAHGLVRLDGKRLRNVRPGRRVWNVLLAFVRARGRSVSRNELMEDGAARDPKGSARDKIRRLRAALGDGDGRSIIATCGRGKWRIAARITVDGRSRPSRAKRNRDPALRRNRSSSSSESKEAGKKER